MPFLKKYSPQIIIAAFLLGYFSIFFGEVIFSPNKYVLGLDSDALKNYYTFAFQVRHQGSSFHFSGMNYPFGEHVLFTDGMPILGFVIGLFPFLKGYEVGIFHTFLFLSLIVGAFLWLKLLRFLKVSTLLSTAGAISIVVMSPQMYRINGHFSLSLMWVLPLIFYLVLQWSNSAKKLKIAAYLALTTFLVFFVHPYLGLMSFLMIAASFLCLFIWKRVRFKEYIFSQGLVMIALVLFMAILKLTDTHAGRTAKPNGFFENFGYLETTFVPVISPLKPLMQYFFPIIHDQPWEAWAYIGCLTFFILIFSFLIILIQIIRRKNSILTKEKDPLPPLFFASILLLLFSYQIPLKWFSEEIIVSLKIVNQFRSLGRFAWVFFYAAQVYAIVLLDRLFTANKAMRIVVALLVPAMAIVESFQMHEMVFDKSKLGLNPLHGENIKKDRELAKVISIMQSEKNAVILPLPFFHIGSERISIEAGNEIKKMSFITSFHTGFPLIASSMSRTSVDETRKLVQLFNGNHNCFGTKEFFDKKMWILTSNEALFFNQGGLLQFAEPKYRSERVSLYLLDYSKYVQKKKNDLMQRKSKLEKSSIRNGVFQLSDSTFFLANDFESCISKHVFAGKGAQTVPQNQYTILAEIHSQKAMTLDASFWYYIGKDENYSGLVVVEEQDTITKKGSWLTTKDLSQFTVFHEEWELVELKIPVKEGPYIYRFFLLGPEKSTEHFTFDNLLIRESNADVRTTHKEWSPNGMEMFNNVPTN